MVWRRMEFPEKGEWNISDRRGWAEKDEYRHIGTCSRKNDLIFLSKEDDVSSWLDCDADDAGFQLMSDDEIIAQVRKPNSDDDNSESDEDEVMKLLK
ncbi:hypothetical protein AVEN_229560-1 [Araneus ventricosus]|uniref:Uncharacterized protein n=1 Tax=Araneus ventricosus TaxID=182803 RepID=A0A4Y2VGW2_ARAVE|nr:hypothetical protein AVEN_229560-1 [Araneus ventricosus]